MNKLVEDELAQFREEIEIKFSKALTRSYQMTRTAQDEQACLNLVSSRITLDGGVGVENIAAVGSSGQFDSLCQSKHQSLVFLD